MTLQPTPPPAVTADAEQWYQTGEPVMFAGTVYYPAGPQIHFNANEMVRSGTYKGVPLYSRTTIEPNSVVFVPLVGGVMQPYERRRDGELAGTVGSSAPSFPVATSRDHSTAGTEAFSMIEAAGPPTMVGSPDPIVSGARTQPATPRALSQQIAGTSGQAVPQVTGTSGRIAASRSPRPAIRRAGAQNGIFVEFDRARWFSSGVPAPLDAARLTRIGESHGFPVYADRGGDGSTIYMPVSQDGDVVARYTRRK